MNIKLLKTLSEAAGVPGREQNIRDIVRAELAPLTDEISVDAMGNMIGLKKGAGEGARRVMIAGHMDEIGFIVRHVDDDGFVSLQPLGGFDPRQLFAQRVFVHTAGGPLRGVLTYNTKPIHMLSPEEAKEAPKLENFYVDLGLSGEEAKEQVRIGDMATMDRSFELCGDCCIGKSLDNRIGVFVMIEALRKMQSNQADIYPVATVQEEIGLRGATTSAFAVEPDIAIALDVTLAGDYPGRKSSDMVTRLGDGVGIKIMDSSLVCHPHLVDHVRELAEARGINHQMEILPRGGTDAGAMQRVRAGAVSITLSVPCRYVHTVNEMCHRDDIQATIDLLAAYLEVAHERDYTFS